jgi:hypothetical protein
MSNIMVLLAGLVFISAGAFAQGAAEGALSHSLSTSMGTAAGKALGNATNQMANRVTGKLGQQTATPVRRPVVTPVPTNAKPAGVQTAAQVDHSTTAEPPAGGSLIQSIQGAVPQSCVTIQSTETQAPAASATDAQNPQGKDKKVEPAVKPKPCPPSANAYQSVINLPAPK